MKRKKILVTGGAGYIGSHTCVEFINAGYEPIILDNFSNSKEFIPERIQEITGTKPRVIDLDCAAYESLLEAVKAEGNINGIVHFAAFKAVGESTRKPLDYYYNNVASTTSILKLMEALAIDNFVFSSSCTVYGQPDVLPVTEDSPIKAAESPYGRTKQICEDLIQDFYKAKEDLKAVSLRYFNPIGAHPSSLIGELPLGVPNNLVPYITQTAIGLRQNLTIFGDDYDTPDGTCIRDYIHVVDLAKAHVAALSYLEKSNNGLYDIFNLGTGTGNSVLEVVNTFEKIAQMKLNYTIGPRRQGDIVKVFADVSKSKNLLNWETKLSLIDALRDAWNWEKSLKTADIS
ncbi:UDP-glucose 4-epimerase GalE [Fulvivirga sp. M361]|uniref:UDP-glucose 4-epimerase GalE n=1 Tax=Fulvivirga sp. M361 TaxID=2594266 RepID=UPI00117B691C|nr:UDP-glucose 4-epimerase GalE [Fulvivirga sp. M361]TRX50964.1 UDP-glucose 4-epimerase GalE [Fulvivirga sp. M361]